MYCETQRGDRVKFRNPTQATTLMSGMAQARKEGLLCDVILIIEGKRFAAHKIVLAMSSDYFKVMFAGNLNEANQEEITINSVPEHIFSSIIDYFYEGSITVDMLSLVDVLHVANIFLLKDLTAECFKYLTRRVSSKNCIQIHTIADHYDNKALLNKCKEYIQRHFEQIIKENEVVNIEYQQLRSIILADDIVCKSEDSVAVLIERWLKERVGQVDSAKAKCLFKAVRIPFLSEQARKRLFSSIKDMDTESETSSLLPLLTAEQRYQMRNTRCDLISCRKSQKVYPTVLCFTKRGDVFCYNTESRKLHSFDRFPDYRQPGVLSADGDTVYATGGSNSLVCLKSVYSYKVSRTGGWKTLASMMHGRDNHCAAVLDGKLYVIGGQNPQNFVEHLPQKAECYDPTANKWTQLADTHFSRVHSSAAASKKFLYIVGGDCNVGGVDASDTCERYCPVNQTWEVLEKLNCKRRRSSAVYYNNKIYAFGGNDGFYDQSNFEFWDESKRSWTLVVRNVPGAISFACALGEHVLTMCKSAWTEDRVYKYSAVKKRNSDVWTECENFVHPSHLVNALKYVSLDISNYEFDQRFEARCDCADHDADSYDEDMAMSSSDYETDNDVWPVHWGLWL